MLRSEVIQALPTEDIRLEVKRAIATLALSRVILNQIETEKENLLSGNSEESTDELAKQIVEYRRVTQQLQSLQELGNFYAKEMLNGISQES